MSSHRLLPKLTGFIAALTLAALTGCGAQTQSAQPANNASQNGSANSAVSQSANQTTGSQASQNATSVPVMPTTKQRWSSPPPMQIDVNKQYDAVVHTNYGNFTIQLFAKIAPHTVNNFVFLAKHNFFHNDQFFRIIKTFMIQTGDPNNNGTGGPGYQFADELPPKYPYGPGIVAMANAGPNTNGSQFFICTGQDSTSLNSDPAYTQFGKVISGMNVVQKIASIPTTTNPMMPSEQSKPLKNAYIESVDIVVK
ncbi:peptidylprolyl isomerase [Alicyclobacillus tolerans]|uniref:peptidylprolyl isomerase n=1 Tax=Alicyclobacillus tolerans TaxID=90970 RepID=UPI001F00D507|nr:peptidylprolyl isomerase [Alicyclobacillus tolerans]MCF8566136.1 peptidylprolyl isomerase [Alicyclobacillus tolerans]